MFGRFSAALAASIVLLAPTLATAAFDDRHLGTDGPWTLYATFQDGKFSWCAAEQYAGPNRMRLIKLFPDSATMVATPTRKTQAFDGGIAVNGHGDGVQWSTYNGWAVHTPRDGYLTDDLLEGRKLQIDVGTGYIDYSLDNIETVVRRLKICTEKKGQP